MFRCCNKNSEIITQFYKTSYDGLLKQLVYYLNDTYHSNGHITSNYADNIYHYYIYEDKNNFIKITVKCQLIENKLNFKMIIYEIIHSF